MSDLKIQGVVEMSAEGAEGVLDRLGDKAVQMAGRTEKAAKTAGEAVGGIGAGADGAAEQFNRAEGKMSAALKRANTNLEMVGKTMSQKFELKMDAQGLDASKFEPALVKMRELEAASLRAGAVAGSSLNSMGMSARATSAALRGVPAQFTDIITSLQGGQAPLTVFMQQGGQLKDMFGGAGNAAKALGSYVIGLVNPLTVAAGAAAALGVAYYQGSGEAQAFATSLIMSGNAAGTTAGQLMDMAKSVSSATGATRGAVAETLNEIAGSGKVAADMLATVSKAAIDMERAGGQAASATVKEFVALGEAPVDAILKLDSKYHFLTASVYEQIKALKDQGRETDAAKLSQTTYADALEGRIPGMVQNLGAVEKAWKSIVGGAKSAWDAMLNVGREGGLEEQLAKAKKYAENLARSGDSNTPEGQKSNTQAQQAVAAIEAQIKKQSGLTAAEGETNKAREAGLKWSVTSAKYLDNEAKKKAEILLVTNEMTAAGVSQAEQAKILAKIEENYATKKSAAVKALKADYSELFGRQEQEARNRKDAEKELDSLTKANEAYAKSIEAIYAPLEKEAASIELQLQNYGLTRAEIESTTIARLDEQRVIANQEGMTDLVANLEREIDARKRIKAASEGIDSKKASEEWQKESQKAADKAADEWKKTADKIGDSITDALMRGFESGKGFAETFRDTVKNMFKTLILRPVIQATVMGGMSALGMGSATAADGGSSLGGLANLASTGNSLFNIGSTIANGAGALPMTTTIAEGVGALGGDSIGTLLSLNPQFGLSTGAAIGEAAGVAAAASYTAAAGTVGATASMASAYSVGAGAASAAPLAAVPVVGWIALAALAAYSIFSKDGGGPQPSGDYFGKVTANGGINQQATSTIAGDSSDNWYTGTESNGTLAVMGNALGRTVASTLKSLGGSAAGVGLNFGMSTDPQGTSDDTVKASVTNAAGQYIYTNNHSVDKGKGGEALLLEFQRMGVAAIKAADDIKPVFKEVVSGIDLMTADAATLTQALADVQAVVGLRDAFKNLNLNADNLSMSIINAAGGISTLSTELGNYYAAYFTEAERTAKTSDAVTKAFKDMGVALPDSKEAFRKVVEGLDLTTASGSATFTAMMDLAPAFATVADAAAAAAKVVSDAAKAAAEAAAKAASEYAAAQRAEKKARADGAQSVLDTLKSSYADIQSSLAEAAKASSGGAVGGLGYSSAEYESVTQFSAYLDAANVQLKAIASSGYAAELAEYTAQIKLLAKSVSDQAADTLYASRLKSGDVAGAIDAALSKNPLKYTDYMDTRQGAKPDRSDFATRADFDRAFAKWDSSVFNAGAFNHALELAQVKAMVEIGNYQSDNALSLQNVTGGYSAQNASAEFKASIFADISKQYGIGTQTALQNVLSKALDVAVSQNIRANYTSTGPGVASVQAAQYDYAASAKSAYVGDKLYVGAGAIAYAEGVKAVTAALSHGAITIADYRKGIAMLTDQFGGSSYNVNDARLAGGGEAEHLAIAGMESTTYYFGKLAEGVKALSDAARKASEPVSLAAESIGRMNSASSVFAQSADAIMQGYLGMAAAGQSVMDDSTATSDQRNAALTMLVAGSNGQRDALTEGSLYRKGELVSAAAGLASGIMTTQSAAAAAAAIAKTPSFAGYTDTQIRDVSMMMDGLQAFDAGSLEKTFNRLSNALATGVLTEAQYIDLFGQSVETFKGVDTAVEATKTAMQSLADAMKSFADEILIDAGKTTLTADQTMAETMRQYGVAMASAMTGDSTAVGEYKTLANSLLDKDKYATQADYNDAFGKVYGDAKNLEAVGVASVARANGESKVVTELKSLNTNLTNRVDTLEKNLTAALAQIARNTAKTSAGIDQINVNGIAA